MVIMHQLSMNPSIDIRCEYMQNPLGLDVALPRFSWSVTNSGNDSSQSAYRVLVASSEKKLTRDEGDMWDSGIVNSIDNVEIIYEGASLKSRLRCYWKVCVWDQNGNCLGFSQPSWFEMGLLNPNDWVARWIGTAGGRSGAARYFRCEFDVPDIVIGARLYIAGLGYHKAYINGHQLGDAVLDPSYTDESKRALYVVHDATHLLSSGKNVLAAIVAPGWRGVPILLAQLEIRLESGKTLIISSGRKKFSPEWLVASGPVVEASVFDGEHYDARLEYNDWNTADFDVSKVKSRAGGWSQVFALRGPSGRLRAQLLEPIRIMREIKAVAISEPQSGIFVFDFGQNHAGWVKICVTGPRGTKIKLRYSELLSPDGTINQENLRTACATDIYVLKGDGDGESWCPQFTYHGYRYVQVEGWPGHPTLKSLTSCVVRSSVPFRGTFECDNSLLNRIHELVRWTEESNLHGIPTDCPQRNERMGWLNDMAARSEELIYNFDAIRLLRKFTADISDAQDETTGALSDTVPFHWGRQPADPVSVCYLMIPWLLNVHYGDKRTLEDNYEGMKRWVDFLTTQSNNGVVDYSYYGDWAPPEGEAVAGSIGTGALSAKTPGSLISTAFYYYTIRLFEKISGILGHDQVAAKYSGMAEEVKASFHTSFWNEKAVGYGSGNQACNSIALYLGLVPENIREKVLKSLTDDVIGRDHHLTTGNLCTKYLLEVLSESGNIDHSIKIATQTSYPSWGFMMESGATTLWERWELMTGGGMNSHNHPMLGSVGSWLYRWVAGIVIDENKKNGRPHFIIRPPMTNLISSARASITTPWGSASVNWEIKDNRIRISVVIPWNCNATVQVAEDEAYEISSGNYVLNREFTTAAKKIVKL